MNCRQFNEQLMYYFDHELDSTDSELFNSHLESCRSCRELFGELSVILGFLETIPTLEPDPKLENKVMERIRTLPVISKTVGDGFLKLFIGSLSFIIILVLLVITLTFNNTGFFDLLIRGRNLIYSFSGILLDFQIIYHFVSGLYSNTIFSIFRQVQSIYVMAIFMTAFLTVRMFFSKLAAKGDGSN